MSEPFPLRELDLPIARELAETVLIRADLHHSLAALKVWAQKSVPAPDEETRTILLCLFRDAVTQFVSCFDEKTNKHPLRLADIYGTDPGADVFFKWLLDIRNAYAAHRFGASRQCSVGAFADPTGKFVGVGVFRSIYEGPAEVQQLLAFVGKAARYVDTLANRLHAEFEAQAKTIPPEKLLKAPIIQLYGIDPNEMGLSRGGIQKARKSSPPSTT